MKWKTKIINNEFKIKRIKEKRKAAYRFWLIEQHCRLLCRCPLTILKFIVFNLTDLSFSITPKLSHISGARVIFNPLKNSVRMSNVIVIVEMRHHFENVTWSFHRVYEESCISYFVFVVFLFVSIEFVQVSGKSHC